MRSLLLWSTVILAACAPAPKGLPDGGDGRIPDVTCMGCHVAQAADEQHLSSHKLLFNCVDCHEIRAPSGKGHAERPSCDRCHSEVPHPDPTTSCTTCHRPHGSPNSFLIRAQITTPAGANADIHLTAPEGATADGLVRAGADGGTPGTGLCEVCHSATRHYTNDGSGEEHHTGWCGECHSHQRGFSPPE